jgi:hypothetical protein
VNRQHCTYGRYCARTGISWDREPAVPFLDELIRERAPNLANTSRSFVDFFQVGFPVVFFEGGCVQFKGLGFACPHTPDLAGSWEASRCTS